MIVSVRGENVWEVAPPPPWSVSLAVFLPSPWTSLSLTEKPFTTSVQQIVLLCKHQCFVHALISNWSFNKKNLKIKYYNMT